MTELLENYVGGAQVVGAGVGTTLCDPVTLQALVRVSSEGIDLGRAFAYARATGGPALRVLGYAKRAALLTDIVGVLKRNRPAYFEIALANSGTTKADSAVDIDGAIFTLGQYARWGAALGDGAGLLEGGRSPLGKDGTYQSQHVLVPARGIALLVNAFNFPAWGLWEKAAAALLSGVPVVAKPATSTAWLAQKMVADVIAAGVLPPGALSIVCGSASGILDPLEPFDVVSFTGSVETATLIRGHRAIASQSVRLNVEADSLNGALLLPDEGAESPALTALVAEVVREMTVKAGQKCTAIRRVLVPESLLEVVIDVIATKLRGVIAGNPRNEKVQMGALVNLAQLDAVRAGVRRLSREANVVYDGASHTLLDVDPAVAACVGPTLLATRDPDRADDVHTVEVFGPVATVMPYRDLPHALALVRRGGGSLVTSVYGSNPTQLANAAVELASTQGRVHVVSAVGAHTGHGNVMPQSVHGGPGRAGGGQELGGLRALGLYHQRAAVQADGAVLDCLSATPLRL